jgi:hypothetical protein
MIVYQCAQENPLTHEVLVSLLRYDSETGLFFWSKPPMNHHRLLEYVAGGITTGYVLIKINGHKYKAHRLAWLYVNGEWPVGDIDHANGCPLDNRIANLRVATNPQNQANRRRDNHKETAKGVRRLPSGRFQARLTVKGKLLNIGIFDTEEAAQTAYLGAAKHYYGDFARAA